MIPTHQGMFIGVAVAAVTGAITLLLPPLPPSVLFPGWILYGCAIAWAILRWSVAVARRLPAEEGIPRHLQAVLIGVLFLTGSTTIASLDLHPRWLSLAASLGYLLAASQGVVHWNGRKPPEAPASV